MHHIYVFRKLFRNVHHHENDSLDLSLGNALNSAMLVDIFERIPSLTSFADSACRVIMIESKKRKFEGVVDHGVSHNPGFWRT